MHKDYYSLLGVSPEANEEEIRVAFEKLSARLEQNVHEDQLLAEAEEAYLVLSDPRSRAEYNKLYRMLGGTQRGYDGLDSVRVGKRAIRGWETGEEPSGIIADTFKESLDWELDLGDLDNPTINDLIMALKNTVLSLLNGREHLPQDGVVRHLDNAHIYLDMPLHPREIKLHAYKFLDYHCYIRCADCGGRGSRAGAPLVDCLACLNLKTKDQCLVCAGLGKYPEENCPRCKGEGRVMARRQAEVKIPTNIKHNAIIQVAGAGHCGFRGLKNGDLFIKVLLAKNKKC